MRLLHNVTHLHNTITTIAEYNEWQRSVIQKTSYDHCTSCGVCKGIT